MTNTCLAFVNENNNPKKVVINTDQKKSEVRLYLNKCGKLLTILVARKDDNLSLKRITMKKVKLNIRIQ
ncbi:hypothetical protein SMBr_04720 [Shewanella sp. M-Br]|nr:hypothetical protein SMBr_04720 [Shewanella sp. M-Br]